jgi:hypothetical protein
MTDAISVTFGYVAVNAYHEAILATVGGQTDIIQGGPAAHPSCNYCNYGDTPVFTFSFIAPILRP